MINGKRLHYAWVVTPLVFVTLLAAAGIRAAPGVLMVPLEEAFGWNRTVVSTAVSVNLILYGLMGPFAAALMNGLGVRRTMTLALAVLAAGVAATATMHAPWQMVLLWGGVVGTGSGMIALVLGATVVSRWFVKGRGMVMGVLTASTATGQLVFLPVIALVVERWGWRAAVLTIAGVAACVLPAVALFMRERPADLGLWPVGAEAPPPPPAGAGNPVGVAFAALAQGLRSRDFWLLAGTFFVCGLSTNGLIGTHLVPACIDHGIPEVRAAGLLAAMGLFDFVGTTASGWLSDRWDNRRLLAWYYGLRGLSLLFLNAAFDLNVYGLWLFALFYGLDWIATVPPTVRLAGQCFGAEKAGIMFGWIFAAHQLGAAAASLLAGIIRTDLGSYWLAFVAAGAACLAASGMALMIGRPAGGDGATVPVPAIEGDPA